MDESRYMELLDKAYSELPEVLYKKERFEVPKVRGKIIKTRTIISNFSDIAKHLSRPTEHFLRFMLKEVGVRGELNERGELILHSKFQPAMLNKAVLNYYAKFVECINCKSPDTILKNNTIVCKACGNIENIKNV